MFGRRPMVGLALCFGVGIGLGWSMSVPAALPWGAACAGWVLALALFFLAGRPHADGSRGWLAVAQALVLAATVMGLGWIRSDRAWRSWQHGTGILHAHASQRVQVGGLVASDPVEEMHRGRHRRTFWVSLEAIGRADEDRTLQPCAGRLHVAVYGSDRGAPAVYGQRGVWEGRLAHLPARHAQAGKDKQGRLSPRLSGRFWLNASAGSQRLTDEARGWRRAVQAALRGREQAAIYLSHGIAEHKDTVGLLHAMLLGDRLLIGARDREIFSATGTWHVFAISGLHVGILVLLLVSVLRMTGLSRERWILFLAPCLMAYIWATGARPSAVRAGLMALIYFLAPLLGRKPDALSALALTGMLILTANPSEIFDLGFVFSFTVVAGLMACFPLVHGWLLRRTLFMTSADTAEVDGENGWAGTWRRMRGGGIRALGSLAALSISAWLASAPLMLFFFGRVTPIGLLANLLAVPLVFLIVLTGGLALSLGMALPFFADVFNHANLAIVGVLRFGLGWLSRIPGGHIEGVSVSLTGMLAWYAAMLGVVFWARCVAKRDGVSSCYYS